MSNSYTTCPSPISRSVPSSNIYRVCTRRNIKHHQLTANGGAGGLRTGSGAKRLPYVKVVTRNGQGKNIWIIRCARSTTRSISSSNVNRVGTRGNIIYHQFTTISRTGSLGAGSGVTSLTNIKVATGYD